MRNFFSVCAVCVVSVCVVATAFVVVRSEVVGILTVAFGKTHAQRGYTAKQDIHMAH